MFAENDRVKILVDCPAFGVKAGEVGTVAYVPNGPDEACEVEFRNEDGSWKNQFVVPVAQLVAAE